MINHKAVWGFQKILNLKSNLILIIESKYSCDLNRNEEIHDWAYLSNKYSGTDSTASSATFAASLMNDLWNSVLVRR